VPWRCHQSLIGDALLIRGTSVEDIFTDKSIRPHRLTAFARIAGNTITYPAATGLTLRWTERLAINEHQRRRPWLANRCGVPNPRPAH